jgi:hypothetical protein
VEVFTGCGGYVGDIVGPPLSYPYGVAFAAGSSPSPDAFYVADTNNQVRGRGRRSHD